MAEKQIATTPAENLTPSSDLVRLENVRKHFPIQNGVIASLLSGGKIPSVKAVDGISFSIKKGEVFGLAGESGSGKSTVGRLVLNLYTPTSGKVFFGGIDLGTLSEEKMRRMRARMQLVFQDPLASLNPRMTIGQAILHPVTIHLPEFSQQEQRQKVLHMLESVGMTPPDSYYDLFPHQISGGQRQRIVLARALVTGPELVVADEPIAMADVSVRALLLDLMIQLKDTLELTYLFITHDLATAKYICDRIGIMYLGKLVEVGTLREIYTNPRHPYTQALLAAVPVPDPLKRRTQAMPEGEIPNPINPPSGCRFHPRCPLARNECKVTDPEFKTLGPDHQAACLLL